MTLKSQVETAKEAVSKALITALENKKESVITDLFDVYNKLNKISIAVTDIPAFNLSTGLNNYNYGGQPVPVAGSWGSDVISFTSPKV